MPAREGRSRPAAPPPAAPPRTGARRRRPAAPAAPAPWGRAASGGAGGSLVTHRARDCRSAGATLRPRSATLGRLVLDTLLSLVAPPLCWSCGSPARRGEPL